ncbi:hypothetical protein OBP_168 [Pseudomonas phage OBP]|uniref:hypothetical protein n=1 Tax=Pseudomonas phage OBP TaxID=1124849 RepID=UPI000240D588|nr:hypothetical protein OBP_168 [Pseudomonas phage OBP]AEV89605.1 hypothetical protein OBP_168 [Pseudomonas phage OBP]
MKDNNGVEYYNPSGVDVWFARYELKAPGDPTPMFFDIWGAGLANPSSKPSMLETPLVDIVDDIPMTVIDCFGIFTEAEREAHKAWLVPNLTPQFAPIPFVLREPTDSLGMSKVVCTPVQYGEKNYLSYKPVGDDYILQEGERFVKPKNPSFPTKF